MRAALLFASAAVLLGSAGTASAQAYGQPYGAYGYGQPYAAPRPRPGQRLPYQMLTPSREVADYYRYRLPAPPRGYAYYRTDDGDVVLAQRSSGVITSVWPDVFGTEPRGYGYRDRSGDGYGRQPLRPYRQGAQPAPYDYPDRGADPDDRYDGGYGQSYGYSQPAPSYSYSQPSSRQGQVFTAPNGRRYTVGPDGVSRWVD